MQPEGTFIVIEGVDGSGKGTQFKKLHDRLVAEGHDVATFDFPRYNKASSHFIKEYLNGKYGGAEEVSPYTGSLFYALDRYEAAYEIRRALRDGKIVLANRYAGSNMAHQGTKFTHPEERRGYFIWLDNLEFQTLGIPRPTKSFVLRVPADIAQTLVDKKEPRDYTDQKRDIHEADLGHLQKTVEVYDDLCQLFPKDFERVDCVRGSKLLDVETVHKMIWEKIEPMLPVKNLVNAAPNAEQPFGTNQTGFVIKNTSAILRAKLVSYQLTADNGELMASQPVQYFVPNNLGQATAELYKTKIDRILELHDQMLSKLPSAQVELQAVLPVATSLDITLDAPTQRLQQVAGQLATDELAEVRAAGRQISPALQTQQPADNQRTRHNVLEKLAQENLPENHSPHLESVTLVNYSPRNELELVADILYEHSTLARSEIQAQVKTWLYEKREQVLKACLNDATVKDSAYNETGALKKARYSFDLMCDFHTFTRIVSVCHPDDFARQHLTPRYGYEVPKTIEAAGLSDQFEECFDVSLSLYSDLQAAGNQLEAQYATLLGHKMRWKVTLNAREAFHMIELRTSPQGHPGYRKLTQQIYEKIAEVHPLMAESMKFVNQGEDA